MNEPPMDLTPLDPDADPQRRDRVVDAAMQQIADQNLAAGEVPGPPGPPPAHLASPWRRYGGLAAALVIGLGIGWFGRGASAESAPRPSLNAPGVSAQPVALTALLEEVDATPEQRARIQTVMRTVDPESNELFVAVARELDRIVASRDSEIRDLLSPDQARGYAARADQNPVVGFHREYLLPRARVSLTAVMRTPE